MNAFLAIITSRLGLGVITAGLIVTSVFLSYGWGVANRDRIREEGRANGLHAEIYDPGTGYKDRLTMCGASLAGTQAALANQNKAVDQLKAESDAALARSNAAVKAAQATATAAQQRAQALLFEQPRTGETRCEAADRLILEQVQ